MKTRTFKKATSLVLAFMMVFAMFASFITINVSAVDALDGKFEETAWTNAEWTYVADSDLAYWYAAYTTGGNLYLGFRTEKSAAAGQTIGVYMDTDMSSAKRSHLFNFTYENAAFKLASTANEIMAGGDFDGAAYATANCTYATFNYGANTGLEICYKLSSLGTLGTGTLKDTIGMAFANVKGDKSVFSVTYDNTCDPTKVSSAYRAFVTTNGTQGAFNGIATVDGTLNAGEWSNWVQVRGDKVTGAWQNATNTDTSKVGYSYAWKLVGDSLFIAIDGNFAPSVATSATDVTSGTRLRLWFNPNGAAGTAWTALTDVMYTATNTLTYIARASKGAVATATAATATANSFVFELEIPLANIDPALLNYNKDLHIGVTVSDPRMEIEYTGGIQTGVKYDALNAGNNASNFFNNWDPAKDVDIPLNGYTPVVTPTAGVTGDTLPATEYAPVNVALGKGYYYPSFTATAWGAGTANAPLLVDTNTTELTDGVFGSNGTCYDKTWTGFKTATAVIDLGALYTRLASFSVQQWAGWGIAAGSYTLEASVDGTNFVPVTGTFSNVVNGNITTATMLLTAPGGDLAPIAARYLRLTGTGAGNGSLMGEFMAYNYEDVSAKVDIDTISLVNGYAYAGDTTILLNSFEGKTVGQVLVESGAAASTAKLIWWQVAVFKYDAATEKFVCTATYAPGSATDKTNVAIPADGFVLAAHGTSEAALAKVVVGDAGYLYTSGDDLKDFNAQTNRVLNTAVTGWDLYVGSYAKYDPTASKFDESYYFEPQTEDEIFMDHQNAWKAGYNSIFTVNPDTQADHTLGAALKISGGSGFAWWNVAVVEFDATIGQFVVKQTIASGDTGKAEYGPSANMTKTAYVNTIEIPENGFVLASHVDGTNATAAKVGALKVGDVLYMYGTSLLKLRNIAGAATTNVRFSLTYKEYVKANNLAGSDLSLKNNVASSQNYLTVQCGDSISIGGAALTDGDRALGTTSALTDGIILYQNDTYKTKNQTLSFLFDYDDTNTGWALDTIDINKIILDFFYDYANNVGLPLNGKIAVQYSRNDYTMSQMFYYDIGDIVAQSGIKSAELDIVPIEASYIKISIEFDTTDNPAAKYYQWMALTEIQAYEEITDIISSGLKNQIILPTDWNNTNKVWDTTSGRYNEVFNYALVNLNKTPYIALDIELPSKDYTLVFDILYKDENGQRRTISIEQTVLATMAKYGFTGADGIDYWSLVDYFKDYGIPMSDLLRVESIDIYATVDAAVVNAAGANNTTQLKINYFAFADYDADEEVTLKDTSKITLTDGGYAILDAQYTPDALKEQFNGALVLTDNNGKTYVGTGAKFTCDGKVYTAVLYGDLNGDGNIESADYRLARMYLLGQTTLDGAQTLAFQMQLPSISATCYIRIRMHVIGTFNVITGQKIG